MQAVGLRASLLCLLFLHAVFRLQEIRFDPLPATPDLTGSSVCARYYFISLL